MILKGLKHRTTRFVGMGTVGETAVFRELEDLGEVTGELFGFHVEGTKALDARGIYHPPPTQGNHLGESGGMLTEVMGIGDFSGAEVGIRYETIDESGLPHPAVAAKKSDLVWQK